MYRQSVEDSRYFSFFNNVDIDILNMFQDGQGIIFYLNDVKQIKPNLKRSQKTCNIPWLTRKSEKIKHFVR